MASNGTNSQPLLPIFKKEKYPFWSLKMKTMFRSQGLCDIVENVIKEEAEEDLRKKDAKALFFIQQSLDEEVFPRIIEANTAHHAWTVLKTEYMGDKRVMVVKLQSLRRDFENLSMKRGESVQAYLSRFSCVVSNMRSCRETVKKETVVRKVLHSLTPEFDHIISAIVESKDLTQYTCDKLMGSLLSHEERIVRKENKSDEKALQVKQEQRHSTSDTSWRQRGGHHGCRGGRGGKGRSNNNQRGGPQQRKDVQCYHCLKMGHMARDCYSKQKGEPKAMPDQVNFSDQAKAE